MSASLVGSEMCIRDRLAVTYKFRPSQVKLISAAHTRYYDAQQQNAYPVCCLLYTSDAADDM
eukprot:8960604-Alexandrium_andersonii.AAC.1